MTVGITAYGAHIPLYRFKRMDIFKAMGWLSPAIMAVAQGERSMCNWDEDSITMAVAATRDCLKGKDKNTIDALYLASTTLPFAERQNSGVVSTALSLRDDITTGDFSASQKSGITALINAMDVVNGGDKENIMVAAADKRETRPGSFYEMWYGDGAAAVMVGKDDIIAEYKGSYSLSYDFCNSYRTSDKKIDYTWEERWVREEGYSKIIPEAVNGLMKKISITMDDVDKLVFPCIFKRDHAKIAKKLGAGPEKLVDNMHEVTGETGVAHPLIMFLSALEEAKPGDRILVAGFGQGSNAAYFVVTDNILNLADRKGVKGCLENKKLTDNYLQWVTYRDQLEPEFGMRSELSLKTAQTVMWRKREMILGFQGGKCRECGTVQYPKMEICVNPECGAYDSQEAFELADVPAQVKSFTNDMLVFCLNPPACYGIVEFETGGRLFADFTDCSEEDIKVGAPVEMVFRRRVEDKRRGYINYYWKGAPIAGGVAKLDYKDKVAIVTGAGAGLGKSYALELAKKGAKVVVNDLGGARDGSGDGAIGPADQVVAEIKEMGGEAVANYDNVATKDGGENIVRTAIDNYGKVDILINNAGILRDKSFLKQDPENWHTVIDVHLNGAYYVTQPAFKVMKENGYGRIVMTTSAAGLYGNFGQTNYTAAKMGVVGMMNTLKIEGKKKNILVNTIAPAAASRLTEDIMPPDMLDKLGPEFVAPLVLYLSSDKCETTGRTYNAGLGYYNRATLLTGQAVQLGDVEKPATVEDIHENFEKINSMTNAKELGDANEALLTMVSPPTEEGGDGQASSGWTPEEIFGFMADSFLPEKAEGMELALQYKLSGDNGGDWNIVIKDQKCTIEKGVVDKPVVTIKMGDKDFVDFATGKLDPMQALASGKVEVEGDMMKIQTVDKVFKLEVPEKAAGESGDGGMTPETIFQMMKEAFKAEASEGTDLVMQFSISGPNGGEWNLTVKDKACAFEKGVAPKPVCTVKVSDTDFVDLMTGKLNPMQAFSSGKIAADGDMMKIQVLDKLFKLDI
jgi:3-hydroxy-3-methylglutaryl CoA synthase/NAD(P)-dependent dehydrogenase (short-subunit alcohol dehydrogenase family)/putative sterol carrier protein